MILTMPQELTTTREAEILDECQKAVWYQFRQPELLRSALTHASGANTRLASNERMEFLGDSVLGLVTCEQLYLRFPDYQEGDLTKIKSAVVSRRTCARMSKEYGLGDYLFLGKGMHLHTAVPANMPDFRNLRRVTRAILCLPGTHAVCQHALCGKCRCGRSAGQAGAPKLRRQVHARMSEDQSCAVRGEARVVACPSLHLPLSIPRTSPRRTSRACPSR